MKNEQPINSKFPNLMIRWSTLIFVTLFFISCKNETLNATQKTNHDIDIVLKANEVNIKTLVITSEFIENHTQDSALVEVLHQQIQQQNKLDQRLKSWAEEKLIVLSDTVFKNQNYLKYHAVHDLEKFVLFIENQKKEVAEIKNQTTDMTLKSHLEKQEEILNHQLEEIQKFHQNIEELQNANQIVIN
jgi:putative sterol carrier protein